MAEEGGQRTVAAHGVFFPSKLLFLVEKMHGQAPAWLPSHFTAFSVTLVLGHPLGFIPELHSSPRVGVAQAFSLLPILHSFPLRSFSLLSFLKPLKSSTPPLPNTPSSRRRRNGSSGVDLGTLSSYVSMAVSFPVLVGMEEDKREGDSLQDGSKKMVFE